MKDKEKQKFEFSVVDKKTNKEADIGEIALKEDWAKGLIYCDMEGFAILEDGNLVLLDECGKWEYCPSGRFEIIPENSVVLSKEELSEIINQTKEAEKNYYKRVVIPQSSKETAEKFYKKVRKLLKKVDIIVDGDEGLVGYEESAVDKGLTEIAKQFGVEIKE